MSLPEFGVKRPVTNLMIFTGLIIISIYGLYKLGVDLMPEVEPPMITVVASYPGASPEDVETNVVEPLENQLATTPGLDKIYSNCSEGAASVTLQFLWGTDLSEASNDIRDRIEMAKRFLPDIPDEMDNPYIFKFNTTMIPIMVFVATADESYPDLYEIIDKKVGDELKQIPGVGTVRVRGGLERQINVRVNRDRLEAYGFSITDIENVLRSENITQPAGNIRYGFTDYLIRVPAEYKDPEEIKSLILGQRKNKVIYIRDVAEIEDGFKEVTMVTRVNKVRSVAGIVQKQTGYNTVEVANRVKARLEKIKKMLPSDVKMYTVLDTSSDIEKTIATLKSTVWYGIFFVILVVWIFLRNLRLSLVVALTIPFSLLIAFIYLFMSGKTINVISLTAIVIASGMVVDNAIVVVDNIYRRFGLGERPQEAAIFGTNEMFLSIAASTLTTVVVFAPLLFVKGVVGIMFGELAAVVIITLIGSLFTAATFTPMLTSQWLKMEKKKKVSIFRHLYEVSEKTLNSIENFYGYLLAKCLKHRASVIIGITVVFLLSLCLIPFIGTEFMTEEDSGDIIISITLPIGTRVEETDKVAKRFEEMVNTVIPPKEKVFVFTMAGQARDRYMGGDTGKHIVTTRVKLVPLENRKRSDKEIAAELRAQLKKIPGIIKLNVSTGDPMGQMIMGTSGKKIQLEVFGHSFEQTDAFAEKLKKMMEQIPGAVDVSISRDLHNPEIRVEPDREKAASMGITMSNIAGSVNSYIGGAVASRYREGGQTYDILVQLDEPYRKSMSDVSNLPIYSPVTQRKVKLSDIAKIYESAGPVTIERKNRYRVLKVECNVSERSMGEVVNDIKKGLQAIAVPEGISLTFGGQVEEQQKSFRDLTLLLILGIMLVYMVMAAQFESLRDPFIIMFSVPFTFTGVLIGFFVTRVTLSVQSFLGVVMLMGIVVNNAIVLISYIGILRKRGYDLIDAVSIGGRHRLRPILMTTLTTIIAFVPMVLFKGQGVEIWKPIGVTMIGGLTGSTLLTLFYVPTMYAIFECRRTGSKSCEVIKKS
jgi:CzcA family heavy metal efflux pump